MIRLSPNVRTVVTTEGGALLDLRRGKMFRINPVGAKVLGLLAIGSTLEEIVDELSRTCGAQRDVAGHDVREFLASLADQQLLEVNVTG